MTDKDERDLMRRIGLEFGADYVCRADDKNNGVWIERPRRFKLAGPPTGFRIKYLPQRGEAHTNEDANMSTDKRVLVGEKPIVDDSYREIDPKTGMQKDYVVLSKEEREKGFVEPVRRSYIHVKCGGTTTMSQSLAETYAADPSFYDGTFCSHCRAHFPVGENGEFVWASAPDQKVGTTATAAMQMKRAQNQMVHSLEMLDESRRRLSGVVGDIHDQLSAALVASMQMTTFQDQLRTQAADQDAAREELNSRIERAWDMITDMIEDLPESAMSTLEHKLHSLRFMLAGGDVADEDPTS